MSFYKKTSSNNNTFQPRQTGDMLIGIRPIMEAAMAGKEFERVFMQEGLKGPLQGELKKLLKDNNISYQLVPVEKLNRLTRSNHQGVIAFISSISYYQIENLLPQLFEEGKTPLLVVLDRITDVRNMGAIARSAECAGAHAIILPSRGSALINADAIKTSAGALNTIPVCREVNLKTTLDYLKESGVQLVACTEKADKTYFEADLSIPTAIIMGSEEEGISGEYIKKADAAIKIPMNGTIDSLNVSVACGIILFESLRQRILQSS